MTMTPTQEILARNAVQRGLLAAIQKGAGARREIVIPFEEFQCLCVAAADALNLDRDAFDLGPFIAPKHHQLSTNN